jgi:cell wall-associated NlpC family hydrolase
MSRAGDRIAARARSLVGTRFRPQGRDPALGLDCVGTAAAAIGIPAERVRSDYALRGEDLAQVEHALCELGWGSVGAEGAEPGDVILCRAGPAQIHMVIATGTGFVHADARLRCVVERPLPLPWRVLGVWRQADGEVG